ncbi:Outer membrane efflux protein [Moorella glycerini]|uniref:Outer membrane efflux protein n=1 Tax=Neomoorella stamsii TaxID=1266720 RepID=A0A9X7J1R8_9FIRM|nr:MULTISPECIES: TolC family protein [Moorella]PRR69978.1 Outer membrane efflux protein [Moorella stamsii]CEP68471.1 Outer membrane efflux protein [Moorella glycerini]
MRRLPTIVMLVFLFLMLMVMPARAEENNEMELTLEEAIKKALLHSDSLKISELELQKSEELKDDAAYALARFSPNWATDYTPGVEPLYVAREQSKMGYEVARKKQAAVKDSVILATHKAYYDVLKKEAQVSLATLTVQKDELKLNNARLSFTSGLISKQALIGIETQLAGSRAALAADRNEMDKAYRALCLLIGLPEDARPVLVDKVDFKPFQGELASQQSLALDESPSVMAAVENARLKERLKGWDDNISDEDIEIARLQASMATDQVKELVRSLYNSVKTLEENYPVAQDNLRLAEENLRVTRIKYEIGMATKSDVKEAEWNLADAQQKLLQLTLDHAYYKLALEKPWAYN